jgi:P-type conjugative transfer protein TrbJ
MKSKIRSLVAVAVAAIGLAAGPARAQWLVLDPGNLAQNIISALEAVSQEANQLKQLQEQVRANQASLPAQQLADSLGQAQRIQVSLDSVMRLKQELGSGQQAIQSIQNMYGASNSGSVQSFMQDIARRKAAGDANATSLLASADAATDQISASQQAHERLISALGTVSGPTEAAQATASAVGTVVQQNQAFLGTISAMARDQGIQRAKEAQREADAESVLNDRESRNADALSRLKSNPTLK